MKPIIRKQYKQYCESMGLTTLQQECQHQDWRKEVALAEYIERLIAIRVDDLLGYDEPGWHSVSPQYAAIEFKGVIPQDVRQSGGDRMPLAAERLRRENETSKLARQLVDSLPPRQRVAVLVDHLRKRHRMTRKEACKPENWKRLVGQLQLSRWMEPGKLGVMKANCLEVQVKQGVCTWVQKTEIKAVG